MYALTSKCNPDLQSHLPLFNQKSYRAMVQVTSKIQTGKFDNHLSDFP